MFDHIDRLPSKAKLADALRIAQIMSPEHQNSKEKSTVNRNTPNQNQKEQRRKAQTTCSCGHSESAHDDDRCQTSRAHRYSDCACTLFIPAFRVPSHADYNRGNQKKRAAFGKVHPTVIGMLNLENTRSYEPVQWICPNRCILCKDPIAAFVYYDDTLSTSVPVCQDHLVKCSMYRLPDVMHELLKESLTDPYSQLRYFIRISDTAGELPTTEIPTPRLESFRKVKAAQNQDRDRPVGSVIAQSMSDDDTSFSYNIDMPVAEVAMWLFDEVTTDMSEDDKFVVTTDVNPMDFPSPEVYDAAMLKINEIRFDFGMRLHRLCRHRAPHFTVDNILEQLFTMKRIPWRIIED